MCNPRIWSRLYSLSDVVPPVGSQEFAPFSYAPGLAVQELGQNRRGHCGEQCVERGGACGSGDTEAVEPQSELIGLDGLPGASSGEEPVTVGVTGAGDVAPSFRQSSDERSEWSGHGDKVVADAQGDSTVNRFEVTAGQAVDPAHRQGVEHDEAPGHPVAQIDIFIKKETTEQVEALAFRYRAGCGMTVRGDAALAAGACGWPSSKTARVQTGARSRGEPGVDVALGGGDEIALTWRSQARSRTAMLVWWRTTEYRLSVSSPASAKRAIRGP